MADSQTRYPWKVTHSQSLPEWNDLGACLAGSVEEYAYGGGDWTNVVLNNASSEELRFFRHPFTIPASSNITGIELTYRIWGASPFVVSSDESPPPTDIKDTTVRLIKNGVPTGDDKASSEGWPAYRNDYYAFDNFCNGVDGSSISSHIPNVGNSWNTSGSDFVVGTFGSLDATSTANSVLKNFRGVQLESAMQGTAWMDTSYFDGTGGLIFSPYGNDPNHYYDLIFRRTDDLNFYRVRVMNQSRLVALERVQSGIKTTLASKSWPSNFRQMGFKDGNGVSFTWKVSAIWLGNSISVIVNNSFEGSIGFILDHTLSDSFNGTAVQHGFSTNSQETWIKKFFVHGHNRDFEYRKAGSPTDLWGTTWTPSDINNQNLFGSLIQIENLNGSDQTAALQAAYITVYYSGVYTEIGRGGLVAGSSAETSVIYNQNAVGDTLTGGSAEITAKLGVREGGIVASGLADVPFVEFASGGSVVGGNATFTYDEIASGGIVASGVAYEQWYIPGQGGVVVSGESIVQNLIISLGGATLGGQHSQTFFDYIDGDGGVDVGGNSIIADLRIVNYATDGNGITIGGSASSAITDVNLTSDGGVEIRGEADCSMSFNLDLKMLWNVNSSIKSDFSFLWNVGQLPIFWYRIVGKGRDGNECNLIADPCCQKFIVNIHARTLGELCDKLRARKLNLPIESVQRFSRPAEKGVEGFDDPCNELVPVEICEIPKCAEFCVDHENSAEQNVWGINMTVQVDSFFDHVVDDGIFIGGSADASFERYVPDFPHIAVGGLSISGESVAISSGYSYEAEGGVVVSGKASRSVSHWSYVGGQWPAIIERQYSSDQESLPDSPADKTWSLVERISDNDGLYASTDISYAQTSHFLIARNFHLDIPSGSNIVGLKVSIDRFATQSGVRDTEVYLVVGDEIISNNLADTTNDWPVGISFSAKKYGQNGFDGKGDPWSDDPLQVEDLINPEFGVALRVQSIDSLPATIANVDYIAVKIFYEDPVNQMLRTSGTSATKSTGYSWVGNGEVVIGGTSDISVKNVYEHTASGGIAVGGKHGETFDVIGSGGIGLSGESVVDPIWGEGGLMFGGSAKITPYIEVSDGGISLGGASLDSWDKRFEATGGVTVNGSAVSLERNIVYEATGGITIGGTANRTNSAWTWQSSGNAIFVLGSADQKASDFGTLNQTSNFSMTISDMIVKFASDKHTGDAEGLSENIRQCGCLSVPLIINLEHNFVRDNILSQFLKRNDFALSKTLQLHFNQTNTSWQTNLHYKGLSADANTQEVWNIVIELQCTDLIGSIDIGRRIWKLSVQFFRKNLTNGDDYDTRIILGILPESICETIINELNFKVTYDTQSDVAFVKPTATIYQSSVFDNIGLFKKPSWIENPDLIFTISQAGLNIPQVRLDLTEEVVNSLNLRDGQIDSETGVIRDENKQQHQIQLQNQN